MRVAVTGAGGFVGGSICRVLVQQGWTVFPFDLVTRADPGHTGGVPIQPYDITTGPLPGAPPVDAVIHVAAYVSDTGPLSLARLVNVTGTAHVVASFPAARFVHISSASVYDPGVAQHQATEDEAPAPDAVRWTNAYGRSKSEAEVLLRSLRPDAVVLRPHAVYGPGDTTLLPRMRAAAARGAIPLPGGGRHPHSVTSVGNLARACLLACTEPGVAGVFNVNDGPPVVLADGVCQLASRDAAGVRIIDVPVPVLTGIATALEGVAAVRSRLTGRPVHPLISRYTVQHMALERTFDISAITRSLGYQPAPSTLSDARHW